MKRLLSLLGGPALAALLAWGPRLDGLSAEGQSAVAVMALCLCWWLFTPVPLAITGLVGLALVPALGALPVNDAMALFGNQAVFFVIAVFLIAAVMSRTGLSTRVATLALRRLSRGEDLLCYAVLGLSWALCAVMVSHAVAALMLPIVLEIARALRLAPDSRTNRRLQLSMAWGTVAGSNLSLLSSARASLALELYQGYGRDQGLHLPDIGFVEYSLMAAPVALISLVVAAVVLRLAFPPEDLDIRPAVAALDEDMRQMGPMRRQEWLTAAVILGMLVAMVITGPSYLGIVALLSCGAMAGLGLLHWEEAEKQVNWGICLMYGGAIAVGMALHRTGATAWLVERGMPGGLSTLGTLLVIATAGALLTEVVSNAAVVALLLPVTLPLATSLGLSPTTFAVLLPVSAGLAYVLPTSTPAMAMVFGTGSIGTRETMRPGVALTAVAILALVACAAWLWPLVL